MKTRIFSTILGSLFVFCILTSVLCLLFSGCGGGGEATTAGTGTHTASGTSYTWSSGTGVLAMTWTSSDFTCNGPSLGTETNTGVIITATTMTWPNDNMTWSRSSGTAGNIVGMWTWSDSTTGNSYTLTVNANGTVSLVGVIVQCSSGSGSSTIEGTVSIEGHVYISYSGGTTHTPIQGAVVSTSLDSQTVTTNSTGYFFLQTNTPDNYSSTPYTITISATGYQTFSQSWVWGDHPTSQTFLLCGVSALDCSPGFGY